jgi:hypothetical protein
MTGPHSLTLLAMTLGLSVTLGLSGCEQADHPTSLAADPTVGVSGSRDGWTPVGSAATRPALSLYQQGAPVLVLTCKGVSTEVQVRGLEPKQAWPQPDLTLSFGSATRTRSPDVRNVGDQVAYEIAFALADDVLDQIAAGAPLSVEFNGQRRDFTTIPETERVRFAEGCKDLVPAGMRQAPRQAAVGGPTP